jgi:predicted amidohydrolase YtcJ
MIDMETEVGSIEVGKLADFTVVGEDPYEVDPHALKDVEVYGTILGGEVLPA